MDFIKVENKNIPQLAELASFIWHDYWRIILSDAQIEYMIENFQSENAIRHQISEEKYSYYFISQNGENIGYFGISPKEDYLFLSKLYIKKEYRRQGIGESAFEKIKSIAKENNLNRIILTVNKYNTNTIKAYDKWGFKTIDSVVTDIGQGFVMDDYIMEYKI